MKRYQNDRGLSGLNTLAYMGVEPSTPPNITQESRRPATHDYAEFTVGDIWLVKGTEEVWILVDKSGGVANWTQLTSGDLSFATADGHTAQPVAGVVNILGGSNFLTTTVPDGSNNVYFSLGGAVATEYRSDSGIATPLAGALYVYASGIGSDNIETSGFNEFITIELKDRIYLPATNSTGTQGVYYSGGDRFIHSYGDRNLFVGGFAGNLTMDPVNARGNVGIGYEALESLVGTTIVDAVENTAVGIQALQLCTEGDRNTACGSESLSKTTTGSWNTACGAQVLVDNLVGDENTAVGFNALNYNLASENTSVGAESSYTQTTAVGTTAVGFGALRNNTTGSYDTCLGYKSLHSCISTNNTAAGYKAGYAISSGSDNVILGYQALLNGTSASDNVCIGSGAMGAGIVVGGANVAIGSNALSAVTGGAGAGSSNVVIGYQAATTMTTGKNNVILGPQAGATNNGNYNVLIGDIVDITGTENICINATVGAESNSIHIGAPTNHSAYTSCYVGGIYNQNADAGGTPHAVYVGSGNKLGKNPSSRKVKENIVDMTGTEVIYNLRPVNFTYISKATFKPKQWGLIAEEVAEVLPELAGYDEHGEPDSVRYEMLPVLLLKEIQLQRAELETLRLRIAELEEN